MSDNYIIGNKLYYEGQYDKAFEYFKLASDEGHTLAQYKLGCMYRSGFGTEISFEKAIEYYRLAADKGHVDAKEALKYAEDNIIRSELWNQSMVGNDLKFQIEFLEIQLKHPAGSDEETKAYFELGVKCQTGRGLRKSFDKAVKCFELSSDKGNTDAQCWLGYMYENGYGVDRSYQKALKYYQLASAGDSENAQRNLGYMYLNGYGVEKSYQKAAEYFELAADKGNADSQTNLGVIYVNGNGVEKSYQKAIKYFHLASDQGNIDSKAWLGYMYENGYGVEKSIPKAVEYFKLGHCTSYFETYNILRELKSTKEYMQHKIFEKHKTNDRLRQQIDSLQMQIKYQPGGSGYKETKIHFKSLTPDVQ